MRLLLLRHLSWGSTILGHRFRVNCHMACQITIPGKTVTADITFEGSLSCVGHLVLLKVVLLAE